MKKIIIILTFIIIIFSIIGGIIYTNSSKISDEGIDNSNEQIKNIEEDNDLHINSAEATENNDINEIQQKNNNNETNTNSKTLLSDTTKNKTNQNNNDNTKATNNNNKNTQTTNNKKNNQKTTSNNKNDAKANTNKNKNNNNKTNVKDKNKNSDSNKINLSKYDFYEKGPNGSYKGFIKDKTEINNLKKLIDDAIKKLGYKIIKVKPDSSLAKSGARYFTANKTNVENEIYDSDGFSIYYYAVKEYIISANGTEKYFQTRSYIKVK